MAAVLVIEDDDAVRFSLQAALESMGHTVESASNGVEGVEKCISGAFDLVITDLIMPEKDGVETILELKLNNPELKIVAISGGGRNVDIMETTYQIGADCALTKPFSVKDLGDCLNRVLVPDLKVVD
ncbi:response regulator [Magnetovibrio sp.]|uniref:response regulator n=1 Tax=Magnetovibrio sp. TaxID=2024836 RepID=UPI002F93B6C3